MAEYSKWIPIDPPLPASEEVKAVVQKLNRAGYIAYFVGGCVRDFLLKRSLKDYDIATSALPQELESLFPKANTVGKSFGVLKISENVEVATFRKDLETRDHRHPKGVVFSGPEEDSDRRDFTVNALYYDLKTNQVLDHHSGLSDLKNKVIRAVGIPEKRFEEDALRMLRAVRFCATLNFHLDLETARGIRSHFSLVKKISAERIREELTKILNSNQPELGIRLLRNLDLFEPSFPEVAKWYRDQNLFENMLKSLKLMAEIYPDRSSELGWSVLLSTGRGVGLKKVLKRLRFSKKISSSIERAILSQEKFEKVFTMREATLLRWIAGPDFENTLRLHHVLVSAGDGNLSFYEFCRSRLDSDRSEFILITGDDLIQLGLKPGPLFSKVLRAIQDLVLEKKIRTKKAAIDYIVENYFEDKSEG